MAREAPYLEVADDLRTRLARGEWPPGTKLPSRAQLAAEYRVGRNVTQRAVDRLIAEGLVEGRAGSGTYVMEPGRRRRMLRVRQGEANLVGPSSTGALELNRTEGAEGRCLPRVPAPARIAARLGIAEGDLCVRTFYEFLVDRQPGQLSESWEPMAITEGTPIFLPHMGPLGGRGLIERMLSIGIEVARAVEVPRPARAGEVEAELLGISVGDLLVRIERTYYATDGRAVETADISVPDLRWEIAYEIGLHRT